MYQRLTAILKRRVHPFGLLAGSLAVVILVTALTGMWHYQYELDHVSKAPLPVSALDYTKASSKTGTAQLAGSQNAAPSNQSGSTSVSKSNAANAKQVAAAALAGSVAQSGPGSAPVPAAVSVSLSVNGSYKGRAVLAGSDNQCDVLSAALSAGLISSLDMRYNAQYKTYAVYVIDGIGDSSAVWWTYQVNGSSPPYGCSNTPVHNGDSVNWQYIRE